LIRNHIISKQEARNIYCNEFSRFIEVDGIDIHYREEGKGFPLVLIHGFSSCLQNWDALTERLKANFRIIRFDVPGFGLTELNGTSAPITVDNCVQFIKNFLDKIGVEKLSIAGSSLGGWIAWEFASAFSHNVNRLVLINSAGYFTSYSKPPFFYFANRPIVKKLLNRGISRWPVKQILKNAFGDKRKLTNKLIDRYYKIVNREGNLAALIKIAAQEINAETEKIKTIEIPSLIIWGDRDKIISVREAYHFHKDLLNSKLIIYKGVGHLPMEEVPDQTANDIHKFLISG